MQSFTPSSPVEGKNIAIKMTNTPCHASTAPVNTKLTESSHDMKTPHLDVKKPTFLLLKENGNLKPKKIIKVIVKPQVPACIKAGDVSSLLDQFLEYEQNQSRCVTLVQGSSVSLTPAASPSHINKPNFTGIGCDSKSVLSPPNGLTPPVSPPLQRSVESVSTAVATTSNTQFKINPSPTSPCFKPTTTLPSSNTPTSVKTISPQKEIPKVIPSNVENIQKDAALKSSESTEAKVNKTDNTNHNVAGILKETKVDIKHSAKQLNPEVSTRLSSETEKSTYARSRSPFTRKADKTDTRKREFSFDDDEEELDKDDYCDFKRKKYTRDECYWTTSEEESDDDKQSHHKSKKTKAHNDKRRHSRDHSSDSGDNGKHKIAHSHHKHQRRHDRSPRRSCSRVRDNVSDSEEKHHRHRRHHHKHKNHEKQSSQRDKSEEDVHLYDIENERKKNFKLDRSIKENSNEKRKIVYIGNIESSMSKSDIWAIFRKFGPIEKTTVHYRDDGDNYSFVTFVDPSSALDAIEEGKNDPKLKHLDICFGGRRKFCGGSYVDFDSTTSYFEEQQEKEGSRKSSSANEEMDFDALLKMCLKKNKR